MGDLSHDKKYSENDNYYGPSSSKLINEVDKYLKPGSKILDLGAGQGKNSIYLAEKGYEVIAVDSSIEGMSYLERIANERDLNIKTIVGDISDPKFLKNLGGNYDAILLMNVIKFLGGKGFENTMYYARNALREGGYHFVETHISQNPKKRKEVFDIKGHNHLLPGELKKLYSDWIVQHYLEGRTNPEKHSNGPIHTHDFANIIAQK